MLEVFDIIIRISHLLRNRKLIIFKLFYRYEVQDLIDNVREKAMIRKSQYSEVYQNPLGYIRVLEKDLIETEGNVPAYLICHTDEGVPRRLQEANLMIIRHPEVRISNFILF